MKTRIFLCLGLAFSLLGFQNHVLAQSASYTLTLKEAVKFALDNSLQIRKSVLDQEQSEYQYAEIRGQALPQITSNGNFSYYPNIPTQILPGEIVGMPGEQIPVQFGTKYTVQGGFELNQKVFDQSLFTGLQAAKTAEEYYRLLKLRTDEDVIYSVANTFYEVLEIRAQITALDSNISEVDKLEQLMKLQYENDLVTKTDYNRLKVNKTNLTTQRESLLTNLTQQTNLLKVLLGLSVENELKLEAGPNIESTALNYANLEENRQIELQLIDKEIELNMFNKQNINAGYYPTLSLIVQQNWQAQRNEFNFFDSSQPWFPTTVVGARLAIPIFDGFQKHNRAQQSRIDIEKLQLDAIQTQRNLDVISVNAREQLANSLKSVVAQKENQQLAQEVYDQTQDLYTEQIGTLTDLLAAENALLNAQINYRRELLKFKKAELNLLKAQGQLQQIIQQ